MFRNTSNGSTSIQRLPATVIHRSRVHRRLGPAAAVALVFAFGYSAPLALAGPDLTFGICADGTTPCSNDGDCGADAPCTSLVTASADPVVAGDDLTYSIDLENRGDATATNVVVEFTYPLDTTFVSTANDFGFCTNDTPSRTVTCFEGIAANGLFYP